MEGQSKSFQKKLGLGVDTGGTYTDTVIVNLEKNNPLAKAKALTTREDLAIGISNSIDKLDSNLLSKISLVSISTTLATNSIVEGKGGRVGLIVVGHETYPDLPVDEYIEIDGGHKLGGEELKKLDVEKAKSFINEIKDKVDAFAISSYLSIRNPEHEIILTRMVNKLASLPVVSGHELSSELGFYERTTTAVLNAKLIPIISELIKSLNKVFHAKKIQAPIMVVRGDGSLMGEAISAERPIETILSGPAASVIGAQFLTNEKDALVIDVGGTTTDIAILREGRPHLNSKGATIGGWKTRVKAIDILTSGVGGDSRIIVENRKVKLSPRRVIPLCIASELYPTFFDKLKNMKKRKTILPPPYVDPRKKGLIQTTDFLVAMKKVSGLKILSKEDKLIKILKKGPHSLYEAYDLLGINPYAFDLEKLFELNIINQIGLTPTDLLHHEGSYTEYDEKAAEMGVEIQSRRIGYASNRFIKEAKNAVTNKITREILSKLIYEQIGKSDITYCKICQYLLNNMIESKGRDDIECNLDLKKKIIGIGAPAEAYLPKVAKLLNTELIVPQHAEVGNAIGAITGSIFETIEILIKPKPGFADIEDPPCILHSSFERKEFNSLAEAVEHSINFYSKECKNRAIQSGAHILEIKKEREDQYAHAQAGYGKGILLETRLKIVAIGKPRLFTKED
jgi:N-methylhydantoinase A/oxoprolinase/acetone carboxylase beta subunit